MPLKYSGEGVRGLPAQPGFAHPESAGVGELAGDMHALAGEGQSLGGALASGAAGADKLTAELAQLAAATKEQRAAEAAASAEVAQAKRALDDQRDALARLQLTYASAGGDAWRSRAR